MDGEYSVSKVPIDYFQLYADRGLEKSGFPAESELIDQVTSDNLAEYILELQNFETRYVTHYNNSRATDAIYEYLGRGGLQVERDPFPYSSYVLENVVATLNGTEKGNDEVYILCAHFDSYSNDPEKKAPGADDNGSGTAAVMLIAEIMAQYRWNATVKFIAFNGEEVGLVGSKHYASQASINGENISGVINLDMIGYNNGDNMVDVIYTKGLAYGINTEWLADEMAHANDEHELGLDVNKKWSDYSGSDHKPFWDNGYDAVFAIEKDDLDYPFYHSTDDTLDKLNMTYSKKVTRMALGALCNLAGVNSTDLVPPSHSLEYPSEEGYAASESVNVTLEVTDPSGLNETSIRLFVNDTEVTFASNDVVFGKRIWTGGLNFSNGQTVPVRIMAEDIYGNALDQTWNFTVDTSPLSTPYFTDIRTEGNSVAMNWTESTGEDFSHYELYFSTTPGGFDLSTPDRVTEYNGYSDLNVASSLGSKFYLVKSVDKSGNSATCPKVAGKITFYVYEGWTLVGNPLEPVEGDPESFARYLDSSWTSMMKYDAWDSGDEWEVYSRNYPTFLSELDSISIGDGYWINVQGSFIKQTTTGLLNNQTAIPLKKGWNLVSFPHFEYRSVEDTFAGIPYDAICGFDLYAEPYRLYDMDPSDSMMVGGGYWVHLTQDHIWTIDNF